MKVEIVKGLFAERQENGKTRIWLEGEVCVDAELDLGELAKAEKRAHGKATNKSEGEE